MIARKEQKTLENRFDQLELLMYVISTIVFTTAGILLIPFVKLYTHGISDVNYIRPLFALLMCLANYFSAAKLPYDLLIFANGNFKETKTGAFIEASLNIIISVSLGLLIGINGIIIGTIFSGIFRTMQYNIFVCKKIVPHKKWYSIFKIFAYSIFCSSSCYLLSSLLIPESLSGYGEWILFAAIVLSIVVIISVGVMLVFFPRRGIALLKDGVNKVIRRRNEGK